MTSPTQVLPARLATSVPKEAKATPLEKIREFLETGGMRSKTGPRSFAEFEHELHDRMMEAERDIVAAEMARLDIDADAVVIEGKVHRRVLRQSQTYMTSAGEVVVERTLYKDRTDQDGRCVSPMELTLGVIGDFWTPRAAEQALWVVTQMTPKKSAELFERVGSMKPSKSSLGRLPKVVAEHSEADREAFEATLRDGLPISEGTVSIAVSLDGVLAVLALQVHPHAKRGAGASCRPPVIMVEPVQDGARDDRRVSQARGRQADGHELPDPLVRASLVEVAAIFDEDLEQVLLTEHEKMVEAFTAYAAEKALADRVRAPGAPVS